MAGTRASIAPGVQVCSLKVDVPQLIAPGTTYKVVRFPFGAAEPSDDFQMHQVAQPDGYVVADWATDDRSGLIWPSKYGWGHLTALLQWEAGTATEYRDQYVRDPLGLTPSPNDTTATEHRPPTSGGQYWSKHHEMYVRPGVPIALRVTHNAPGPLLLTLAEFKLAIHHAA